MHSPHYANASGQRQGLMSQLSQMSQLVSSLALRLRLLGSTPEFCLGGVAPLARGSAPPAPRATADDGAAPPAKFQTGRPPTEWNQARYALCAPRPVSLRNTASLLSRFADQFHRAGLVQQSLKIGDGFAQSLLKGCRRLPAELLLRL